MAHWSPHVRVVFHCEQPSQWLVTANLLAEDVSASLGLCVMVEDYVGAWEGSILPGHKVTWIAPVGPITPEIEETIDRLESYLAEYTGNHCLMPTIEQVRLRCKCDE